MRDEMHGSPIGISVINPGFIRDAGMFADSGASLPKGIGSNTPEDVAAAVVRAIKHDKGDVDVAPAFIRFSAKLNALTPELVASMSRRLGGSAVSQQIAEGQRAKRCPRRSSRDAVPNVRRLWRVDDLDRLEGKVGYAVEQSLSAA